MEQETIADKALVPSVRDPLRLSASGIECLQSCPRRFYWRYDRNLERVGCDAPPQFAFGEGIHKALEIRAEGASVTEQLGAFDALFNSSMDDKKTNTVKGGRLIIKDYNDEYEDEDWEVLENEYEFEVGLGAFVFFGRFDKIVLEHGQVRVLDHKTTGRLGEDFYAQCNPNGQFTGYIYAADCEFGSVDSLVVDGILKPYNYKTKPMVTAFDRHITTRLPFELEEWKRNTTVLLENLGRYRDSNYYPKHDNGFYCSRCDFKELCQTPQPINEIEVPEENYRQRRKR